MGDMTHRLISMCNSIIGPKSFVSGSKDYEQHNLFTEQGIPTCSCPAFTYSKADPPYCKHLNKIVEDACGWSENSVEIQEEPAVCPRCNGESSMVEAAE